MSNDCVSRKTRVRISVRALFLLHVSPDLALAQDGLTASTTEVFAALALSLPSLRDLEGL